MAGMALLLLSLVALVAVVVALRDDDGTADEVAGDGDAVDGIPLPRDEGQSVRSREGAS